MNLKLKAFTLIELIVVMMLFGIIMTIAYNSLLMVQQLYRQYEIKKSAQLELEEFIFYVNKDFKEAIAIKEYQDELTLIHVQDTVLYHWDNAGVTRLQAMRIDTFNYQISQVEFEYALNSDYIKSLNFYLTQNQQTIEIQVNRQLDAKSQFQLKE